jgi:hypothetical protein
MTLLQDKKIQNEKYIELLKVIWSLSKLFSDSTTPYLYYRVAENIFCSSFHADNLSRSDCSADARLDGIWYWLKTFTHKSGKAFEKVAEFNAERNLYAKLEHNTWGIKELVTVISWLRNRRLESTMTIHWLSQMMYHCITRKEKKFMIHEEKMDFIDTSWVRDITHKKNSISFNDWLHEYLFNISKSTLFKRFIISPIYEFEVHIFEDPLVLLEQLFKDHSHLFWHIWSTYDEVVYLPLYSERWEIHVPTWSGLNQWNAKERQVWTTRHPDELYIPIPSRIHRKFPNFFPENNATFNLYLPNSTQLSAKACQQGRKALMSNPNKALWKRLLRDVLKKKAWELVTYEDLQKMGVDTVEVAKKWNEYYINFKSIGKYEKFKTDNAE